MYIVLQRVLLVPTIFICYSCSLSSVATNSVNPYFLDSPSIQRASLFTLCNHDAQTIQQPFCSHPTQDNMGKAGSATLQLKGNQIMVPNIMVTFTKSKFYLSDTTLPSRREYENTENRSSIEVLCQIFFLNLGRLEISTFVMHSHSSVLYTILP